MSHKRPCSRCPVWYGGFCTIRGKRMVGQHDSCAYGRGLMRNAYSAKWMRRKRLGEKGRKSDDVQPKC